MGWAWLSLRGYGWVVLRLVYDVLKVLIAKGETRCRVCAAVAKGMGSLIEKCDRGDGRVPRYHGPDVGDLPRDLNALGRVGGDARP